MSGSGVLPAPEITVPRAEIDPGAIEVRPAIDVRPVIRLGIDGHHTRPHRTSPLVEVGGNHVAHASLPIRRAPLTRTSGDLDHAAAWNHGDYPKSRPGSLPQVGV